MHRMIALRFLPSRALLVLFGDAKAPIGRPLRPVMGARCWWMKCRPVRGLRWGPGCPVASRSARRTRMLRGPNLYAGRVPAEIRRRRVFTDCPTYSAASGRVRYWCGARSSLDVAKVSSWARLVVRCRRRPCRRPGARAGGRSRRAVRPGCERLRLVQSTAWKLGGAVRGPAARWRCGPHRPTG